MLFFRYQLVLLVMKINESIFPTFVDLLLLCVKFVDLIITQNTLISKQINYWTFFQGTPHEENITLGSTIMGNWLQQVSF